MTTALEPIAIDPPSDTAIVASRPHRLLPRFALAFLLGLAAVLALGAGALYAYDQRYIGRVLPGVRVGDVNLAGLDAAAAGAELHARYDGLAQGTITVVAGQYRTSVPFATTGRAADVEGMVVQALSVGRAGNPVERMVANARTAVRGVEIEPQVTYDRDRLAGWLSSLAAVQSVPPVDAAITTTKTGYTVTAAVDGRKADAAQTIATLGETLGRLDAPASVSVELPFRTLEPALTTAEARAAVDGANRIAADVRVVHEQDSWTVSAAAIRAWITFRPASDGSFEPVFNESGLDPIVKTLAQKVYRPAKDAGLKLVGKHIVATVASREGRTLDAAGMKTAIIGQIGARQAG